MKVLVQWTTSEPGDWEELNVTPQSNRWKNTAKRPVPKGGEKLDKQKGWIFAVSVDGLIFQGFDHYAVDTFGLGKNAQVRVRGWVDDTDDFSDPQALGYAWGEVWLIGAHRADQKFNGAENTYQTKIVYAENLDDMGRFFPQETSAGPVELRPWSEFPMPADDLVRHGIWTPDDLFKRHHEVRSLPDWKGWV